MLSDPDGTEERLQGSVERVTFHSPESGFCVLRVKVRGHRDLVTVIGSAATITPGEHVECTGTWTNDRHQEQEAGGGDRTDQGTGDGC